MSFILFSNPLTFLLFFFHSNVLFQPSQYNCFCLGKKTFTQNRLFSIFAREVVVFVGKMVICPGKMIFLYQYFLLSQNKLQQQIKLIAQCLYFLMGNNAFQSLCNMYDPCHSVIFKSELKEERSLPRSNKTLTIEYSQLVLVCINFVSFGSLKNSSDN